MHTTHAVAIVSAAALMMATPVFGGKHGHLEHAKRRSTSLLRHMRETTANDEKKYVSDAVACALEAAQRSKSPERVDFQRSHVARASGPKELRK